MIYILWILYRKVGLGLFEVAAKRSLNTTIFCFMSDYTTSTNTLCDIAKKQSGRASLFKLGHHKKCFTALLQSFVAAGKTKQGASNAHCLFVLSVTKCYLRCRKVAYCSKDCQTVHWPHHRNDCAPR